jgi:hypothetical protein
MLAFIDCPDRYCLFVVVAAAAAVIVSCETNSTFVNVKMMRDLNLERAKFVM